MTIGEPVVIFTGISMLTQTHQSEKIVKRLGKQSDYAYQNKRFAILEGITKCKR